MKTRLAGLLFLLSVVLNSCEKNVSFKLHDEEQKLVVEATIENGQVPTVVLSNSLDYFSAISPEILEKSFVHDADVSISNGTLTHKLKEYTYSQNGYNFYYYSVDSSSLATAFAGQLNTSYSLKINVAGNEYNAVTTIPKITKVIDSVFTRRASEFLPDSLQALVITATDPPGYGDYVRYYTKDNSEPFYPGINSVFDDQIIDGTTYTLQVDRGYPRNLGLTEDNLIYFNKGDTVTFKLCNIDKATFDFWRTMEFAYASVGNPFSSPTKVLSNIGGNGLGYFAGYAAQYRTIVIPK
ncbi:MAG: DUF4249 domain-containing protein [Chitinophagaceae bacterium]